MRSATAAEMSLGAPAELAFERQDQRAGQGHRAGGDHGQGENDRQRRPSCNGARDATIAAPTLSASMHGPFDGSSSRRPAAPGTEMTAAAWACQPSIRGPLANSAATSRGPTLIASNLTPAGRSVANTIIGAFGNGLPLVAYRAAQRRCAGVRRCGVAALAAAQRLSCRSERLKLWVRELDLLERSRRATRSNLDGFPSSFQQLKSGVAKLQRDLDNCSEGEIRIILILV